jgi:hypothetical protein
MNLSRRVRTSRRRQDGETAASFQHRPNQLLSRPHHDPQPLQRPGSGCGRARPRGRRSPPVFLRRRGRRLGLSAAGRSPPRQPARSRRSPPPPRPPEPAEDLVQRHFCAALLDHAGSTRMIIAATASPGSAWSPGWQSQDDGAGDFRFLGDARLRPTRCGFAQARADGRQADGEAGAVTAAQFRSPLRYPPLAGMMQRLVLCERVSERVEGVASTLVELAEKLRSERRRRGDGGAEGPRARFSVKQGGDDDADQDAVFGGRAAQLIGYPGQVDRRRPMAAIRK